MQAMDITDALEVLHFHHHHHRQYRTETETKGRPKESDQIKLTEEQLLICAPFVRGYSFKTKEWGE
jgi:hypothetical protein